MQVTLNGGMLVRGVSLVYRGPLVAQKLVHVSSTSNKTAIIFLDGNEWSSIIGRNVLISSLVMFGFALLLLPSVSRVGGTRVCPNLMMLLVCAQESRSLSNTLQRNLGWTSKDVRQCRRERKSTV